MTAGSGQRDSITRDDCNATAKIPGWREGLFCKAGHVFLPLPAGRASGEISPKEFARRVRPIFSFYMGKKTSERKHYSMDKLVVADGGVVIKTTVP